MVHSVSEVRTSPLAGRWYPGQAETLTAMIDEFLKAVPPQTVDGNLLGLLAPHAGYRYSGPVAAYAFALVSGMSFDTVIVIGPMHHALPGAVLTTTHSAYETPLGTVPVDRGVIEALGQRVRLTAVGNDPEHSVEIELPFLQHVLEPGFTFVPLMLRDQSAAQVQALSQALAELLEGRQVLMVASSDLSHYYPQEIANQFDSTMLACVEAMDVSCIIEFNENQTAFACGYGGIATVVNTVRLWGADRARIVRYATSGDITGDYREVVGYGAAVFYQAT